MMLLQVRFLFLYSLIFGTIYTLLYNFSSSHLVLKAALVTLAIHLADLVVRFVWNSFPSQILPDFAEKAVFITGCDTGFGNLLAKELDSKGLEVFAGCLFAEGPGASQLKEVCSKNLHIVQIDVTKDEQISEAVKYVKNTLNKKPLHALVNNAGVFSASEAEFLETEELKRILEVNLVGVARVTRAFLPLLRKSKGRIVITASLASTENLPFGAAYTTSKHAVLSYANVIRRELMRWSVSVHTIEPGLYRTEMNNEKLILSNMENSFDNAPEEVRADYGDDYKTGCKTGYNFINKLPVKRITEVTDCLTDAIIAKYPKNRYHPGLIGKIYFWILTNYKEELLDLFYHVGINLTFNKFIFNGLWKKKN